MTTPSSTLRSDSLRATRPRRVQPTTLYRTTTRLPLSGTATSVHGMLRRRSPATVAGGVVGATGAGGTDLVVAPRSGSLKAGMVDAGGEAGCARVAPSRGAAQPAT